jgi:hypothetical protein
VVVDEVISAVEAAVLGSVEVGILPTSSLHGREVMVDCTV